MTRSQTTTGNHCRAAGCSESVAPGHTLCARHWSATPHEMKAAIGVQTRFVRRAALPDYTGINALRDQAAEFVLEKTHERNT